MNSEFIYIGLKLFNYNDKIQAEIFEKYLKELIDIDIFMPFRDSKENEIMSTDKSRVIYNEDIKRLSSGNVKLFVLLYDGRCKDEGISFEIGFSYGKSIPIFIINTDFIWYSNNKFDFLFDSVINQMCSKYHHQYKIEKKGDFLKSLEYSQSNTFKNAVYKIKSFLDLNKEMKNQLFYNITKPFIANKKMVFIDFGGGKYEYQREYAYYISNKLNENQIINNVSKRNVPSSLIDYTTRGREDIVNLCKCDIFVCSGDEIEINSGTAALIGLAKSMNKKIILYESSDIIILGENNHRMKKNLMIDYSIDYLVKTKKELIELIINIVK